MKLPIADCRLPIGELFAGRGFARRCHDGSQFVCFLQQRGKFFRGHDFGFDEQFEPERGLISFFFHGSNFGNEFCLAAGATTRPIIRRDRCSTADDLFGNNSPGVVGLWNRPGQFNNPQGKCFGTIFQLQGCHAAKLRKQSAIGNRQSAISK